MAAALGWANCTVVPAATEKSCQLMIAFWLDWVMIVLAAEGAVIAARPATTIPPLGCAAAKTVPVRRHCTMHIARQQKTDTLVPRQPKRISPTTTPIPIDGAKTHKSGAKC